VYFLNTLLLGGTDQLLCSVLGGTELICSSQQHAVVNGGTKRLALTSAHKMLREHTRRSTLYTVTLSP
jgi:hypothetical protein